MNAPETDWSNIALVIAFFIWAFLIFYIEYRLLFWKNKYKKSERKVHTAYSILRDLRDPDGEPSHLLKAMEDADIFLSENKK